MKGQSCESKDKKSVVNVANDWGTEINSYVVCGYTEVNFPVN